MMKLLLGVHVAGGSVALLSMLIPLISRKGGPIHVRAGWVFVAGMTIVSITALMLSVLRFLTQSTADGRVGGVLLFYIAILTGAGVSAGIRVLRAKKRTSAHRDPWDIGVATLLTAGGILVVAYGIAIGQALLISFAIIGMINGGGQLAYWLRPPGEPMHWWYEHMNQMLGACIAATTAFVVNNAGRLGLPDTSLLVWLGPALIGVPATIIWTRYYRRRFASTRPRAVQAVGAAAGAAALVVVATLSLLPHAYAQALAPGTDTDAFEVASLKPSMSGPQVPLPRISPDGQLRINGVTLRDLIRLAYPSPSGQVRVDGGPSWVIGERFDVIARTDGSRPTSAMLRRLLQERFKLQARTVTRDGTVFALVLARRDGRLGPSITETPCLPATVTPTVSNPSLEEMRGAQPPATECSTFRIGAGPTFFAESITMARFAAILSEFPMLGNSPVIDRTGLLGTYSFELRARADNNPNPEAGALMPVALEEQLGLKLERTTGPVDTVVVEQVSAPDAN